MLNVWDIRETNSKVRIRFSTHLKTGGNAAPSTAPAVGHFKLYKGDSTTARSVTTGLSINTYGTGVYALIVDLTDTGDGGFTTGDDWGVAYQPSGITVDGETVAQWIGAFNVGTTPTTTMVAAAVWAYLKASITTANSIGEWFINTLGAPAGASLSADVAAVKSDTATLTGRITATLFTGITSLAQWLGAMAGKQTPDSTAQTQIRATGAGSGTFTSSTDSLEAVRDNMSVGGGGDPWGTDITTGYAAGTAGYILNVISTRLAGITSLRQWLGALFGKQSPDATALTEIRSTGAGGGTFDPTTDSVESLQENAVTVAQVKAQVVAALVNDTYPEPVAAPPATASIKDKLGWVTLLSRNRRTLTKGGAGTVYADNGTTEIAHNTETDDSTTYDRGKIS